jgi:hypothetical protein
MTVTITVFSVVEMDFVLMELANVLKIVPPRIVPTQVVTSQKPVKTFLFQIAQIAVPLVLL